MQSDSSKKPFVSGLAVPHLMSSLFRLLRGRSDDSTWGQKDVWAERWLQSTLSCCRVIVCPHIVLAIGRRRGPM